MAASQSVAADLRQQLAAEKQRRCQVEEALRLLQQQHEQQAEELARQRQQRSALPAGLGLLRRDSALAARLGLDGLSGDGAEALIRVVAVLAQMNNIERLWGAFKETCERERRPASTEETDLLQTALGWHNYNWARQPYKLHNPQTGAAFDYNKDQRSVVSPSGEMLSAVWLPGIMTGSGKSHKKALVVTR